MGLVVLETRVSFSDSIDDGAVPFPFLCFPVFIMSHRTLICFLQYLFGVCLPQFGFVMMLYFATSFYYYYDMMLILRTFSLHTHESTLQFFLL